MFYSTILTACTAGLAIALAMITVAITAIMVIIIAYMSKPTIPLPAWKNWSIIAFIASFQASAAINPKAVVIKVAMVSAT